MLSPVVPCSDWPFTGLSATTSLCKLVRLCFFSSEGLLKLTECLLRSMMLKTPSFHMPRIRKIRSLYDFGQAFLPERNESEVTTSSPRSPCGLFLSKMAGVSSNFTWRKEIVHWNLSLRYVCPPSITLVTIKTDPTYCTFMFPCKSSRRQILRPEFAAPSISNNFDPS